MKGRLACLILYYDFYALLTNGVFNPFDDSDNAIIVLFILLSLLKRFIDLCLDLFQA